MKKKQNTNEMVELKLKIFIYKVVKEISRLMAPLPPTPAPLPPCPPPPTHTCSRLSVFIWDSEAKIMVKQTNANLTFLDCI